MTRIWPVLVFLLSTVIIAIVASPAMVVVSQSMNPQIDMVINDIRKAESAGAEPGEMGTLISQMNHVVQLQDQLQNLSPQDTGRRMQLLDEINRTLTTTDGEAIHLESTASQRTYASHVVAYASGVIGAAIATGVYYYGMLLYRRYRIRRTFQMKIIPK